MKALIRTVFCGLLLIASTSAGAGGFFGAGGSLMSLDDGFDTYDPINGFLRAGLAINENVEVGFEYNITLLSDEQYGLDWDVDTTFIFAKINLLLNQGSKLYFMIGAADVEFTGSVGGSSASLDDSGTGYGFGAQFVANERAYYALDYIFYYDDNEFAGFPVDTTVDAFNFSYVQYFE